MTNKELAAQFYELCTLTQRQSNSAKDGFRAKAYSKVGDVLSSLDTDLSSLEEREIARIPGIGPSSAKKIHEALCSDDGLIPKLKEMRKKDQADINGSSKGKILGQLKPVFCVIKLNVPAISKAVYQIRDDKVVFSVTITSEGKTRFLNMLRGISVEPHNGYTNPTGVKRICASCPYEISFGTNLKGEEVQLHDNGTQVEAALHA